MLRKPCVALTLSFFVIAPSGALAQVSTIPLPQASPAAPAAATEGTAELEEIEVTGTRIKKTAMEGQVPVYTLSRKEIDQSGLGSIGEVLQELTSGGKALNSKFNSSGNFGYPADGGGIGAGSSQVDLRHLESKRVLVLVDGLRWVNESSASGVGGSVDLNTIPLAIVERIEVLEDGASAIYGSDAIAGVINIITRKRFEGAEINGYYGLYDEGDGETTNLDATWGMSAQDFNLVVGASWYDQQRVSSADREQSRFPVPGTGNTRGSGGTPQGRFSFCDPNVTPACDPDTDYLDLALDDGTATPVYDPASPNAPPSTYHDFSGADRFNFAPYNLLVTPSERISLFAAGRYEITTGLRAFAKALYNTRESVNQAAPEPIFVGPDAGTGGIADTVVIPRNQEYNPFGIDLGPDNFSFIGRRPLEGGPRIFEQEVTTTYVSGGLQGDLELFDRLMSWDLSLVTSTNEADQTFRNGYNVQHIKNALGDPAACAAIAGCVPLDIFGGQGADGRGTITQEMLDYIRITTRDSSENQLNLVSANLTGDIYDLPAGALAFATGIEYRKYEGSFTPDPARVSGESQDSTAIPTAGEYDVAEVYGELNIPVIAELQFARRLDLSLALRYSDYSSFGNKLTGKAGFRWEIVEEVMARGTYAQGFRAPFIGELYGLTQFAPTITDPCSNQVDSDDNDDGTPDPDTQVEANCRALGVPDGYEQINPQIITNTGGNPNLKPEKADSYTLGLVYSPNWVGQLFDSRRLDFELTYYSHTIEDAVRAPNAQNRLNDCVNSGDPDAAPCQGISRTPNGQVNRFLTLLANAGEFKTSGWDLKADWSGPVTNWGSLTASLQSTYVSEYTVTDDLGSRDPRTVGIEIDDSAIPRVQANAQIGWTYDNWSAGWTTRYIGAVDEVCSDGRDGTPTSFANLGLCSDPANATNELEATFYNDVQVGWDAPFGTSGLHLDAGIQNVLDQDPPECLSCSLNGYDAGTYDAPGQFGYLKAQYRF